MTTESQVQKGNEILKTQRELFDVTEEKYEKKKNIQKN